jgi:hypothetical protein
LIMRPWRFGMALSEGDEPIVEKHTSRHCHLCGRRLWGNAWVYAPNGVRDGQAVIVCRHCQETAPHCDVCGVPMSERHVRLPDGRRICTRCHQTAVHDSARAQALFEHVTRVIVDQLGLRLNVGTDFTLVDHQHLRRLIRESNLVVHADIDRASVDIDPDRLRSAASVDIDPDRLPDRPRSTSAASADIDRASGDEDHIVGLFVRKGRKRVMYLLSGLPQVLLIQTVAHEWAHAWQGENCPLLRDPLVREGFAEWVAYKTLQAMGAVKKMALMRQQEGLYGEGLQKMLELEQRDDASGVIAFCRQEE